MSDTVVMIDLVGSTQAMAERGIASGGADIADRLQELVRQFMAADPAMRQVGEFSGDGALLIGDDPASAIRTALRCQAVWSGLAARIAIAVGPVTYREGAGAQGAVINLAARLVNLCQPGGVVLTEAASEYVLDYPELRRRMVRRHAGLKGFGPTWYWTINGRRAEDMNRRILLAMGAMQILTMVVVAIIGVLHLSLVPSGNILFEHEIARTFADERGLNPSVVFRAGSTMYVRRMTCVTGNGRVRLYRFLLNGTRYNFEEAEISVQKGCRVTVFSVPLPASLALGHWKYHVLAGFVGGELRAMTDVMIRIEAP